MSEQYPISEELKVIEGQTLYKTEKWWAAVFLLESFGRRQIAFYLWLKRTGSWKRSQKYVIRKESEWAQIADIVERLMPKLAESGKPEQVGEPSESSY